MRDVGMYWECSTLKCRHCERRLRLSLNIQTQNKGFKRPRPWRPFWPLWLPLPVRRTHQPWPPLRRASFELCRLLRVFSLPNAILVARTGELWTGHGLTHRCGVDTDRAGPYENIYVSSRRSRALHGNN